MVCLSLLRKGVWQKLRDSATADIKPNFQQLQPNEACHILRNRSLGVGKLRFLPKEAGTTFFKPQDVQHSVATTQDRYLAMTWLVLQLVCQIDNHSQGHHTLLDPSAIVLRVFSPIHYLVSFVQF